MQNKLADIIDLQAYRQSRSKPAIAAPQQNPAMAFTLQPLFMWVPVWGFVPVVPMGVAGYGA